MTAFKYRAMTPEGTKVNGVIEAYDEFEAVARIKEQYSIVLKVEPVPVRGRERIDINEPLWISDKVLSLTASQFAILLRTGLPSARTVEVIAQQTSDRLMKHILTDAARDVSAGYPLAQSLESRGKKIPATFIETVRAGEESGTLDAAFQKLAKYYDKSNKLHAKVRGAMAYPALLCVLAVVVVAIMVNVTVPVVSEIIVGSGGTLPWPTRFLLGVYDFFGKWWPLVLGLLVAAVIALRVYGKTEDGRLAMGRRAMKRPVLGRINVMNAAAQFANTMTTLLSAGLPLNRALNITGKVMDNYAAGTSVAACTVGIEEGKRLGEVLKDNPYLPPLLTEMAAVGEESGALEDTLGTIGEYFDSEVEQATAKALGMLEPVITIAMGLVIGFIVIALYLPMFNMYSGI